MLDRLRDEYEEHARAVLLETDDDGARVSAAEQASIRRIRLRVLDSKRRAVTRLRDSNRIDDIVLREVQATMDLEEVRLLGPVPTRLSACVASTFVVLMCPHVLPRLMVAARRVRVRAGRWAALPSSRTLPRATSGGPSACPHAESHREAT